MTGPSGRPVEACQPTTDSRWVDREIPAIFQAWSPSPSATAASTLAQMTSALCSTHPGAGEVTPTGAEPTATTCPARSTSTALVLVVP